jgi:hypothetical protein
MGGETGDPANCLTPAQLKTIAVYHEGYTIPYAFANGITRYEGYNSLEGITMQLGSDARFIDPPPTGPNAHHVNRADCKDDLNWQDTSGHVEHARWVGQARGNCSTSWCALCPARR